MNPNAVFDFSEFPILTTERLRLRALTHDDAEALMAIFGSPDVLRYLNQPPLDTREKAAGLIAWFNSLYQNRESVNWAVTRDGRMIGLCGCYAWDRDNRRIDLGYHILPAEWGRGYATEAARAIIRWCFDWLGCSPHTGRLHRRQHRLGARRAEVWFHPGRHLARARVGTRALCGHQAVRAAPA